MYKGFICQDAIVSLDSCHMTLAEHSLKYGRDGSRNLRETTNADGIKGVFESASSGFGCYLLTLVCYFALLWRTLRFTCFCHLIILYPFGCVVVALFFVVDKAEWTGMNLGSKGFNTRATVSTEEDRPAKMKQAGALCDKRRSENVPVLRRQDMEDREVEVDQLVRALSVKDGAVL